MYNNLGNHLNNLGSPHSLFWNTYIDFFFNLQIIAWILYYGVEIIVEGSGNWVLCVGRGNGGNKKITVQTFLPFYIRAEQYS